MNDIKSKTVSELILSELIPFTKGSMMNTPEDDLDPEDAAAAYRLIDYVEKLCKARKDRLKPVLHQYAEDTGKATEKGGFISTTSAGFKVTREKRVANEPEAEGIKVLLKDAGLPITEAFTEIKVLQMDASKVNFLIESGKIDKADVTKLKKVTWAMKVVEPKEAKPLLANAKPE